MEDPISKALNIVPFEDDKLKILGPEPDQSDSESVDCDIEYARQNLYDVVQIASSAVDELVDIAKQSQHPKAYEALNAILKTKADVAQGLADLQMKKQRLKGKPSAEEGNKTINNNMFVGSTAELLQMISQQRDEGN